MKNNVDSEKLYKINGENFTIDQLREGYRVFSDLDNDAEITVSDEEICDFMEDALFVNMIDFNVSKKLN